MEQLESSTSRFIAGVDKKIEEEKEERKKDKS